jgi:hypothetical protein
MAASGKATAPVRVNGRPSRATQGRPSFTSVGGPAAPRHGLLLGVLGAEAGAGDLHEVRAMGEAIERGGGQEGFAEQLREHSRHKRCLGGAGTGAAAVGCRAP